MPKLPIGRVASSLNCVGWNRQFGAGAALTEITLTASVPGDNDRGKDRVGCESGRSQNRETIHLSSSNATSCTVSFDRTLDDPGATAGFVKAVLVAGSSPGSQMQFWVPHSHQPPSP
jgi:hypothetical protein